MKIASNIFALLAILATNISIGYVSFKVGCQYMGEKYLGWSAPTEAALLYILPFLVVVSILAVLAAAFRLKAKK